MRLGGGQERAGRFVLLHFFETMACADIVYSMWKMGRQVKQDKCDVLTDYSLHTKSMSLLSLQLHY